MPKSKTIALALAPLCLVLMLIHPDTDTVSLCRANPHGCWMYHFFHANLLHLAINCWTVIGLAFMFQVSIEMLVYSYIVASLYPFAGHTPIVGLSGIAFCLMGCVIFQVGNKSWYLAMITISLTLGIVMPGIAGMLHTWCFLFGILHAMICNRNGNVQRC